MNSAVSYQDNDERMWIDEFGPFVFAQVSRLSTQPVVKKLHDLKVKAVRHQVGRFKFAYCILDTREMEKPSTSEIIDYCNFYLADQFKAGLEHVTFLTPNNRATADVLNEALKSLPFKALIDVHETFERALQHTTQLWLGKIGTKEQLI